MGNGIYASIKVEYTNILSLKNRIDWGNDS